MKPGADSTPKFLRTKGRSSNPLTGKRGDSWGLDEPNTIFRDRTSFESSLANRRFKSPVKRDQSSSIIDLLTRNDRLAKEVEHLRGQLRKRDEEVQKLRLLFLKIDPVSTRHSETQTDICDKENLIQKGTLAESSSKAASHQYGIGKHSPAQSFSFSSDDRSKHIVSDHLGTSLDTLQKEKKFLSRIPSTNKHVEVNRTADCSVTSRHSKSPELRADQIWIRSISMLSGSSENSLQHSPIARDFSPVSLEVPTPLCSPTRGSASNNFTQDDNSALYNPFTDFHLEHHNPLASLEPSNSNSEHIIRQELSVDVSSSSFSSLNGSKRKSYRVNKSSTRPRSSMNKSFTRVDSLQDLN